MIAQAHCPKFVDSLLHLDPEVRHDVTYFDSGEASLRLIRLWRGAVEPERIVVFVPGWASTLFTWRYFLTRLVATSTIHYFESREKASSVLANGARMDVPSLAADLVGYLNTRQGADDYLLVGASAGATLILQGWRQLRRKPRAVLLLLPNRRFPIPRHVGLLRLVPERLMRHIKPFAVHFMSSFRLTPREVEQHIGMFAAVNDANFVKLRASGLSLRSYLLDRRAGGAVDRPCLVIGASQDRLHNPEDVIEIQRSIPGSSYVDLRTFTAAHNSKAADLISRWIASHHG